MNETVFISYRHSDGSTIAGQISKCLEENGFTVLKDDETFVPGRELEHEVFSGIKRSKIFIAVLTNNYADERQFPKQEWTYREAQFAEGLRAADEKGFRIIPVRDNLSQIAEDRLQKAFPRFIEILDVRTSEEGWLLKVANGVRDFFNEQATKAKRQSPSAPVRLTRQTSPPTWQYIIPRKSLTQFLDNAWMSARPKTVVVHGWSGNGKTTGVNTWLDKIRNDEDRQIDVLVSWSFDALCEPALAEESADVFIQAFTDILQLPGKSGESSVTKARKIGEYIRNLRTLVILDNVDGLLDPQQDANYARIRVQSVHVLIQTIMDRPSGSNHDAGALCVLCSSVQISGISSSIHELVGPLTGDECGQLLERLNVKTVDKGDSQAAARFSESLDRHPMSMVYFKLLHFGKGATSARVLCERLIESPFPFEGKGQKDKEPSSTLPNIRDATKVYLSWLKETNGSERVPGLFLLLRVASLIRRPFAADELADLIIRMKSRGLLGTDELDEGGVHAMIARELVDLQLFCARDTEATLITPATTLYEIHPMLRHAVVDEWRRDDLSHYSTVSGVLFQYYLSRVVDDPKTAHEIRSLADVIWYGRNAQQFDAAYRVLCVGLQIPQRRGFVLRGCLEETLNAFAPLFDSTWTDPVKGLGLPQRRDLTMFVAEYLDAVGRFSDAKDARLVWARLEEEFIKSSSLKSEELSGWARLVGCRVFIAKDMILLGNKNDSLDQIRLAEDALGHLENRGDLADEVGLCRSLHNFFYPKCPERVPVVSVPHLSNDEKGVLRSCCFRDFFWRAEFLLDAVERHAWYVFLSGESTSSTPIEADDARRVQSDKALRLLDDIAIEADELRASLLRKVASVQRDYAGMYSMLKLKIQLFRRMLIPHLVFSFTDSFVHDMLENTADFHEYSTSSLLLSSLCCHIQNDMQRRDWFLRQSFEVCRWTVLVPFQIDALLYSARLCHCADDLTLAEELMNKYGCRRRAGELDDAKNILSAKGRRASS